MITSIWYDQHEMIKDILNLHLPGSGIELDPTYSKGNFYKKWVPEPKEKYDLFPQTEDTIQSDAKNLPRESSSVASIMFDPPFLVGYTTWKQTGIIWQRFNWFRYIEDLWKWYDECLLEFHRILSSGGVLIFKCQDTVSSGKQYLSHVHIINEAEKLWFYTKDMFVLLAKNRIIWHNHHIQKHARKFHSYFLIFKKK